MAKFKNAFNTLNDRRARNCYVPKKENIFGAWKRYIRMEKNAVNVIGAIARRRLRAEVFERIRLVGRERHLDSRAAVTCHRLFATIKHGALLKAFSRWRENTKKAVLHELAVVEAYQEHQLQSQGNHIEKIKERRREIAAETIRRTQLRKIKGIMD